MTRPLRFYVRRSPFHVAKSTILKALYALIASVPDSTFVARLPDGLCAELSFHEVIGQRYLIYGGFEIGETTLLQSLARRGTTAIDVGANVGLLTVALAYAVGGAGTVWACEPAPQTIPRLRRNVALNKLANVRVFEVAVGESDGTAVLNVANDPAYHSLGNVYENRATGEGLTVNLVRLDTLWHNQGEPEVSVIKIDTEGTEAAVINGATELIRAWRPTFVVEAPGGAFVSPVRDALRSHLYVERSVSGLHWATHVFVPSSDCLV